MEQRPTAHGGRHGSSRALSASARARLAAALRDDRAESSPGPTGNAPERTEPAPPRLPPEDGLEPVRRLGRSSWLVREVRSGEEFVLRPCPDAPGPQRDGSRTALRSLAVALAGREAPCVVAVRGLLGPAAAPAGLVEEYLPGGSLADRLAGRGRLDPAEVAVVLRDAATGLASLHALGRCHGGLTARQILFRTPVVPETPGTSAAPVTPAGPAAVRAGTAAGSPEDDVRDLGVVGWAALTGRSPAEDAPRVPLALLCPDAPPGLVGAVEAALDPEPAARPTAEELAGRLATPGAPGPGGGSAPAWPYGPDPGREDAATARPARSGSGRRALLVGGVTLVLAAGSTVLLGREGSPPAPPPAPSPAAASAMATPAVAPRPPGTPAPGGGSPGASPPAPAVDPRRAVQQLVARRGEALRTGDAGMLEEVYAPGAEAAAADRETIARAAGTGHGAFAELVLEVESVRAAPAGSPAEGAEPGTVVLLAEVRVEGYRGGPGSDAESVVPSGDGWLQTVVVTLVNGEHGWRLARVDPATGTPAASGAGPARGDPRG